MESKICYNCFSQITNDAAACPHCGYDPAADAGKYPLALPHGSILNGRYIIGRVLGQGGFGITYIAQDVQTGERVAIKEYFPETMATRTGSHSVTAFSGQRQENFAYGMQCFLSEAQTLAQFIGTENIVRVHSYFEENGTGYFVMDYVDGVSFQAYLKQHGGKLPWEEARRILLPVMDALSVVHSKGIIHRDISPDNIYITTSGQVKLLDFGAARYSLGDKSRSLDVVLKPGYAPKEQYIRRGKQGAFTDVYAMAATLYFALTGKTPPESVERMDEDELILPSSRGSDIPENAETALEKALSVQAADRYQTMGEFMSDLVMEEEIPVMPPVIMKEAKETEQIGMYSVLNSHADPLKTEESSQSSSEVTLDTTVTGSECSEENKVSATEKKAREKFDFNMVRKSKAFKLGVGVPAVCLSAYFALSYGTPVVKFYGASMLHSMGKYEQAIDIYQDLGDYRGAVDLIPGVRYDQAVSLREAKDFDRALKIFQELKDFSDSVIQCNETNYQKGLDLLEKGSYDQALKIFQSLNGYSDSKTQCNEVNYRNGMELLKQKEFEKASKLLKPLGTYKDAEKQFNETYYQHGQALLQEKQFENAAKVFDSLNDYSDSRNQYYEAQYQYGILLREQGDHLEAYNILKTICGSTVYKDSEALATDSAMKHVDDMVAAGKYNDAINALKSNPPTQELKDKLSELCGSYAQTLYDQGKYEFAMHIYTTPSGYDKKTELYKDLRYESGVSYLKNGQYETAVTVFEELGKYRNASEKINEAKYGYVKEKYDLWKKNPTYPEYQYLSVLRSFSDAPFESGKPAEYLDDLCKVKYKNAQKISDEVYTWKIKFIAFNNDPDNITTDMSSISAYDQWYCHFKLVGGKPGESLKIKYKMTFPDKSTFNDTFDFGVKRGDTSWVYGYYITPKNGKAGTFKVDFYDSKGKHIGSDSVFIKY